MHIVSHFSEVTFASNMNFDKIQDGRLMEFYALWVFFLVIIHFCLVLYGRLSQLFIISQCRLKISQKLCHYFNNGADHEPLTLSS